MKTVVIFSHSYQEQSVSNKAIEAVLKATPDVEVRNLEELYPDGKINVEAEQAALVKADVVVFQYPLFWFNIPSLLKKWMDDVLQYGFAYGSTGDKLKGKKFIASFTTGSGAESYPEAMTDVICGPLRTSALFCGMEYLEPVITYGQLVLTNPNAEALAKEHAQRLVAKLQSL